MPSFKILSRLASQCHGYRKIYRAIEAYRLDPQSFQLSTFELWAYHVLESWGIIYKTNLGRNTLIYEYGATNPPLSRKVNLELWNQADKTHSSEFQKDSQSGFCQGSKTYNSEEEKQNSYFIRRRGRATNTNQRYDKS